MNTFVPRLELYRFCPRCGAEAMQQRPPHLTICASCDLHLYHNACAASAAIIVDDREQTLLIRRARAPALGKLALAGGFVDNDESVETGLRREVREEVGLELERLEFLLSHPNVYPYRGVLYHTIDLIFVARVPAFDAARPLDAVAELVVLPVAAVRADDLAFPSMQVAWRAFHPSPES